MRVGIFDSLALNAYHNGFTHPAGLPPNTIDVTRFESIFDCFSVSPCVTWTPTYTPGNANDHATQMARAINGHVEPSPYVPGSYFTAARKSGVVPNGGASLRFYGINGQYAATSNAPAFIRSIDRAILDQVDVVDLSQNFSGFPDASGTFDGCCQPCDQTCDCGGMNGAIRSATDSGILIVKSAGNFGERLTAGAATRCLTTYPAIRRDVLVAGGTTSNPNSTAYDSAPVWPGEDPVKPNVGDGSSRGGAPISSVVPGQPPLYSSAGLTVVDLLAPAEWTYGYVDSNSYSADLPSGTSFSAASLAGAAALVRSGAAGAGWWHNWSGRSLLVNMLLMGDGYKHGGGSAISRFDPRSGAGRAHLHYPSSANIGSVSGWTTIADTVMQGQTKSWWLLDQSLPPSSVAQVTQVKVAMTFSEPNLANAADLDLRIVWSCAGTGYGTVLASQLDYDVRNRITLRPTDAPAAYQNMACWAVSVNGYGTPNGTARSFNLAYYYHNQDPAGH